MAAMGTWHLGLGIDNKPVHNGVIGECHSPLGCVTAGDMVGGDGWACFVLAMSSSLDCSGCGWTEDVG